MKNKMDTYMFQQVANQSLGYNMNIKISHMVCHSLPSTWKEFAINYNFKAKSCLFLTKCKFIRWTWMTMNLLRNYDSHVYSKAPYCNLSFGWKLVGTYMCVIGLIKDSPHIWLAICWYACLILGQCWAYLMFCCIQHCYCCCSKWFFKGWSQ
jgi:hypothetical protein